MVAFGIPNSNDTITINSGKPNLELDQDRTVNRLIQYGSTIDLDTNELHVTQRASFNGGDVIGASLKLRGTYAYFQGTDFNCTLDVIVGQIKFSGGTFDQNGSFEQNGSASGWGDGGCVFNADVTIKNSGTAYLRMGEDFGDTFNGKVYLISSGGYAIQMAFGDTSYFNDTIYINSNANGGVYFCNATSGAMALLGDNACLVTGSTGISAGTIQFKNIFQTATTANSITASGSVLFNVFVNTFGGKVNFTAPNLIVKTSTFNDSTFLTKTGSTLNNTWEGNNTYNAVVTITNGNTLTAYLKLASQSADVYNEDVYFNAGTGPIQTSNAGTNIYNGNVAVNGNNVTFNNSGGTLKFAGSEDQEFGGGTSTLTFNKLIVDKPGGIVTLNQPITIDSSLQLSNGIVYTYTLITLKATATTTGANNLSYVDGTVKKIGNTAFIFPVGADNSYYPIEISAPAVSTESFTAKYFAIHHSLSDSCDTTVSSISTCNYWQLKRNTGSTNVQVRLYWDSLGCGLFDTSGIHILNWNGVKWKDLGASGISGNARVGSIGTSVTVAQFDFFTLGISLPVINVNPTLGDDRDLPIDFFGFNGGNTIQVDANDDPVQTWEILHNNEVDSCKSCRYNFTCCVRHIE
ncbi:MAG: hypothetical protein IPM91_04540 [Bacteroidetes bacterium]|nr:hypothetical protein [Bacteroidota bacterium]